MTTCFSCAGCSKNTSPCGPPTRHSRRSSTTPRPRRPPPPRPAADTRLDGIDLHNTSALSTDVQHRPIEDWFAARKIAAAFDHKAIDTSGFFDEAALEIGRNFDFLKPLIDQIRFAQGRGFTQLNLTLVSEQGLKAHLATLVPGP